MFKAETPWTTAIWLGRSDTTDEHIVGDAKGVFMTRTVRRTTAAQYQLAKLLLSLVGLPWEPGGSMAKTKPKSKKKEEVAMIIPIEEETGKDQTTKPTGASSSGTGKGATASDQRMDEPAVAGQKREVEDPDEEDLPEASRARVAAVEAVDLVEEVHPDEEYEATQVEMKRMMEFDMYYPCDEEGAKG